MDIVKDIIEKAKKNFKTIILPETHDDRTLKAAIEITKNRYAKLVLIGEDDIKPKLAGADMSLIEIVSPKNYKEYESLCNKFYELRKDKGMTMDEAKKQLQDRVYFGMMLLYVGKGDGLVTGATHPTADTFRPALQIIKTKDGFKTASSFFLMIFPDKAWVYADCGFNIQPNSEQLAEIAIASNDSAKAFGIDPKVALLSFSTKGSGKHPDADKVIKAYEIVKSMRPDIKIDGELQFDSALLPSVASKKCPGSPVGGQANVFIFPDLDAGNIGYKITERLGKAIALGPISQGLRKPVNDLSRGCSAEDIALIVCVTAIQP